MASKSRPQSSIFDYAAKRSGGRTGAHRTSRDLARSSGVPPVEPSFFCGLEGRLSGGPVAGYVSHKYIDYLLSPCYESIHPCSMRGVSGDDPEGGAGNGVPRVSARCQCSREVREIRPPGTTTWLRGARC